jgi:pimeloyl-ACP methyl ester carboxylesterase
MARLVLVHGAFAGAWKWERLIEPLRAAGHTVEALDLPGSGTDQTPIEDVTLDAYVDRVIAELEQGPEPAVLIASSQTAARRPELVAGLVYVAAFAPRDGQSLLALTQLPEGADDQVQANLVVEGDPPVAKMSQEASRSAAYLETSDEDFEWASPQHPRSRCSRSARRCRYPRAASIRFRARTSSARSIARSLPPCSGG